MLFKPSDIEHIVTQLKQGAVGIFPCDTVFGIISCVNDQAATRIRQIKGRQQDSPFIALLPNEQHLHSLCDIKTESQKQYISHYWPGPYTFILDKKTSVSACISKQDSLALRCPEYLPLNFLLDSLDVPIISTSANKHGDTRIPCSKTLDPDIVAAVDFCFTDVEPLYQQSSHIWDIRNKVPQILRQGPL